MISLITGKIMEIGNRSVIVDIHGIGYKVNITENTAHGLKNGNQISLWTHFAVREDSQDLYGFIDRKDRDFFELLISISGIGPKSALNILSIASTDTLANAIRSGSTAHLVKVSGIGRKTAEKIVLELKDKLGTYSINSNETMSQEMSSDMDAIEALKSLGYDMDDAREVLKKIDKQITNTGDKVKAALKILN